MLESERKELFMKIVEALDNVQWIDNTWQEAEIERKTLRDSLRAIIFEKRDDER